MTSQSSATSLSKPRQSWLDLVSQASPPAGETGMVCSVQVHSHQHPAERTDGVDAMRVLENSSQQDSTESNEENTTGEEEEAQREASDAQEEEGETFLIDCLLSRILILWAGFVEDFKISNTLKGHKLLINF